MEDIRAFSRLFVFDFQDLRMCPDLSNISFEFRFIRFLVLRRVLVVTLLILGLRSGR